MGDSSSWPSYLVGPKDSIFAIGIISLNYGQLENIFATVFASATGIDLDNVALVFYKVTNDVRLKIIEEAISNKKLPEQLESDLSYFLDGYKICALNRHSLMHSSHSGISFQDGSIVLSKNTRAGGRVYCFASTKELRAIADAIHALFMFGAWVASDLVEYLSQKPSPDPSAWRSPLRDRPPLPHELNWRSQASLQTSVPPLQSSPA